MSRWSVVFLLLALASGACGDGGTAPPVSDEPTDDPPGEDVPPDTVSPSVVAVFPEDGATGVSVNAYLRVTFSEPVLLRSGSSWGVELGSAGPAAPGNAVWNSPTVITFSPWYPLDPAATYESTLSTATVTDTAGNPLAAEHVWSFTTLGDPLPEMEAEGMMEHVRVLAHDSMRGRFTGSPEELQAAYYVRERFRETGLEEGAPGYLQSFRAYVSAEQPEVTSQNVIGVLAGRGELADQWLVVGAHYDHVGVRDGEIYNGADDNASGTAMMMELAEKLAGWVQDDGLGDEDRRSVMFHAYGAEEVGLEGSEHFCANPTVAMSRIVGMMNLDMVGRLRARQLSVIGPFGSSSMGRLFAVVNRTGLELRYDASLNGRSDQACFLLAGKPVAFLHTGLHGDYHTPLDDVERLNGEGMAEVADLALRALVKLMVRPVPVGDG